MEKPQIVINHELTVEHLKQEAQEKGIEFVYEYDLEADLKEQIRKIKLGKASSSFRRRKTYSNPGASLPILEYAVKYLEWAKANKAKDDGLINGTTRQSTLAIYYMQKALKFPRSTGNKSEDAGFVKFLIGKDFDEIRKLLKDPHKRPNEKTGKATEKLIQDLTIVLTQFKKIQFIEGVKLIENDLNSLENDLKTFNPV